MSGSVKVGLRYIEKWRENLENQVQAYERECVQKGLIVFYGPSNFTRWNAKWGVTPLSEALTGASGARCAVNRGFGSSCPEHQLYYYPRLVRPLEPRVLVYSPRLGNGKGFGYTVEEQFALAQRVVLYALADFPTLHVYIEGENENKPMSVRSPLTNEEWQRSLAEEKARYNSWLQAFARETPNCRYLSLSDDPAFSRDDIYAPDNVHYNHDGYQLYADFYRRELREELDKY